MEVIGKIIQKLNPLSGTSKTTGNQWKKQEYVLETEDAYPKKVFFDFFGDRAEQFPLNIGDRVRLSFDIESREYNGRWYTNIRGWKADKLDQNDTTSGGSTTSGTDGQTTPPPPDFTQSSDSDDLPF